MLYLLFSKQRALFFLFLMRHMDNENTGGFKTNNTVFPNILISV